MDSNETQPPAEGELDPLIAGILFQLWGASREEAGKPWSLARLSKRAAVPMSTLHRYLTQLEAAGLVRVELDELGRGNASLLDEGMGLCAVLFETSAGHG